MARQVLPIAGAVVGFVASGFNPYGAQVGFVVGSMIGNAVDPVEMQGRKLGDAPTQVAAEGGARAIVYGKGCIRATCILERGGRRVIRQRDRSGGKGGGPTTINERALWTFAIGLGEPVGALLRIWENEKLVYDVTEGSQIPEDTAAFSERFRFYTGAEDQLPDPALEALHGIGNTPYYRGTAYMVFPQYDLTDFGETVPTYRVEVATLSDHITIAPTMALGNIAVASPRVAESDDALTWPGVTEPRPTAGLTYLAATGDRFIMWGVSSAYFRDAGQATWTLSTGSLGGSGGPRYGDASGDLVLIAGGTVSEILRSMDRGVTFSPVSGSPGVGYIAIRGDASVGVSTAGNAYTGTANGGAWAGPYATGINMSSGANAIADDEDYFYIGGAIGSNPGFAQSVVGSAWAIQSLPYVAATQVRCIAGGTIGTDKIVVVGADNGEIYYRVNGGAFQLAADTMGVQANSVVFNGERFIMGGGNGTGVMKHSVNGSSWTTITQPFTYSVTRLAAADIGPPQQLADPIPLSDVVAAAHDRCGHTSQEYDVSELSEMISGVVFEQTLTGAEAINSLIGSHFADPSDYDGEIHYIKRGKPVVLTLTEDDLIDEPDEAQRNNAIEYPKKVHFLGQRADLAYASSKSTSSRYSEDARVVGEITIGSPETYDDGTSPAEVAVKLHKVLWTEAEGEREWMIPDTYLGLVPTDNVGLSYRGELVRCRILNVEDTPGQRKLKMVRDRQSAYTANLTEIPNPPAPTPPQSSVVAPTIMAVIDASAITDNADTLHYLVALSGANDNWAGAQLQQRLSGTFNTIDGTTLNSIMGTIQNTVYDASTNYTDTTNSVVVRLFMDDQLEAISQTEFLSNGGAFFASWQDSGDTRWEIMQYRDAVQDSNGDWVLSHLMRGRRNTETAEHPPGSMFVFIDPAILRESAQVAWLDTDLTHRAVSNGQSPELAAIQDNNYVGYSQTEWPVADILLDHSDPDALEVNVVPRHRFGTSMNPVQSVNWLGFRITTTDGVNTEVLETTSRMHSFDVTGWGSPLSVTVVQLNRFTGAGPSVTEVIP